jgi:hypothetical protein
MKKSKKSSRYATKKELLSALKSYPKQKDFESYVLIIEHRKINTKVGLIIAELLNAKEKVAVGKATVYPRGISDLDSFNWGRLKVGESEFTSFALDTKKQTMSQTIVNAIKKSLSEGRIPFLTFK